MAEREKKGLVARYLEGAEKDEDYARKTLPTNRWQQFKDIFTQNWKKLVLLNLFLLVCFLPLLFLALFRDAYVAGQGTMFPFNAGIGFGYPATPDVAGLAESIVLNSDLLFFALFIACTLITSIAVSGCMYVIRNMVWTEGVFVANDLWRGIRLNYFSALATSVLFTTLLMLGRYLINLCDVALALAPANGTMFTVAKVLTYVVLGFFALVCLWMLAVGSNYKVGFFSCLRNSILLTVGTFPQTLFFVAIMALPVLLLMGGSQSFLFILGAAFLFLFTFSFMLLVWTCFTQWAFDKFVNSKIKGAKVNRGIYTPNKTENDKAAENSAAAEEYRRALILGGKSDLVSRPIKPLDDDDLTVYELPDAFSREDLAKLRASKQAIQDDSNAYAEEHKNDERYVEYNKMFEEATRSLAAEQAEKGKKGKKKLKTYSKPLDRK